jgi:hypothetical protein
LPEINAIALLLDTKGDRTVRVKLVGDHTFPSPPQFLPPSATLEKGKRLETGLITDSLLLPEILVQIVASESE